MFIPGSLLPVQQNTKGFLKPVLLILRKYNSVNNYNLEISHQGQVTMFGSFKKNGSFVLGDKTYYFLLFFKTASSLLERSSFSNLNKS